MKSLIRMLTGRGPKGPGTLSAGAPQPASVEELESIAKLKSAGNFCRSLQRLLPLLDANPSDADAHLALCGLLLEWGRVREASASIERLLERELSDSQLLSLADLLVSVGRAADAVPLLERIEGANRPAAARRLCIALRMSGRYEEAVAAARDALSHAPGDADLVLVQALALTAIGEFGPAAELARKVLQSSPRNSLALFVLGTSGREGERFEEAAEAFALARQGDSPQALPHLGVVDLAVALETIGRHTEALDVLRRGILDSPSPEMHRTYGQMLLRSGQFQEGWEQYEFRWFIEPLLSARMRGDLPSWRGEPLAGKTILLRIEQGLGDTIQFMRYAPSLKALGARVAVGPIELADAFAGVDGVLGRDFSASDIDCYAGLMTLPRIFGSTADTIPVPVPYVNVDAAARDSWLALFQDELRPRIALVWAGNPSHPENRYRSLPLRALEALSGMEGIALYSLQKVLPEKEDAELLADLGIVDLAPHLQRLEDTAGILEHIDLLITVDTSLAHLAGALGRPVWLLNAYPGEWRWMGRTGETPWYPSMRIFGQATRGEWGTVIGQVAAALAIWTPKEGDEARRLDARAIAAVNGRSLSPFTRETGHVLNRNDVLLQYVPARDVVGACLERNGEYQQGALATLMRFTRDGMTVVEARAGAGHHTIQLARRVRELGHVVAFEPDVRVATMLRENLAANAVRNVSVVARHLQATSDEHGDTIDEMGLSRLDVIKIDGMAAAEKILAGAERTLWKVRPRIFVECGPGDDGGSVATWLGDRGYRLWRLDAMTAEEMRLGAGAPMIALPEETEEANLLPVSAVEWTVGVRRDMDERGSA